jgi:hypothetical protein
MLKPHNAIAYVVLTALTYSSQAQSSFPPRTLVIQQGVVLKLATIAELSSATAKKGDDIPLQLTRPLVVDGITLLQAGAQINGRVSYVKKAGPKCARGLIEWDVAQVLCRTQASPEPKHST